MWSNQVFCGASSKVRTHPMTASDGGFNWSVKMGSFIVCNAQAKADI
ncbi:hypothetical protein CFter6_0906 [Collimonas fungivorans]|uniref:Uncharacterized protein n=1 Tax=Collimonas fungivorans TaxID=158899 RepID=A0A127P748_9BURK|nr:hypothetical protein CFter6_0906 [Collimonas fungivorans]